jgi:hypothetical protein
LQDDLILYFWTGVLALFDEELDKFKYILDMGFIDDFEQMFEDFYGDLVILLVDHC